MEKLFREIEPDPLLLTAPLRQQLPSGHAKTNIVILDSVELNIWVNGRASFCRRWPFKDRLPSDNKQ